MLHLCMLLTGRSVCVHDFSMHDAQRPWGSLPAICWWVEQQLIEDE